MKRLYLDFSEIVARYLIIFLAATFNLGIFYLVFTPLTVYPIYFVLGLFFDTLLIGNVVIINNEVPIELIKACIAGSAYYLLFILNLSVPKIKLAKRIKILFLAFMALLIFNILRILLLSFIFLEGLPIFVLTHQIFWYFMSTIFVVVIWFAEVKFFKIKKTPFYSDFRFLHKHSVLNK
ncbi:MAG TPA: pacearchaeosortase [Candidatus Nanoarchaeia archaeon]|nr:pacearchaeosortase [Candidatus Nanoarchaeia archaeon]